MNTSLPTDPRSSQAFLAKSTLPLQFVGLLLLTVLTGWGFSPHRHLHALAWTPLASRHERGLGRFARAIGAMGDPSRCSQASGQPRRGLDIIWTSTIWTPCSPLTASQQCGACLGEIYKQSIFEIDSLTSPRTHGVLPWQLEWSYRRLVKAMASNDSHNL